MPLNQETYDLIESYLQGSASTEEQKEVERLLVHDPEFQEVFESHQRVHLLVEGNMIQSLRDQMSEELPTIQYRSNLKWWILGFSLAVIVLAFSIYDPKNEPVQKNSTRSQVQITNEAKRIDTTSASPSETAKAEHKFIDQPQSKKHTDFKKKNEIPTSTVDSTLSTVQETTNTLDKSDSTSTKLLETNQISDEIVFDPCEEVSIKASPSITNSCIDDNTGTIVLNQNKISGGQAPYQTLLFQEDEQETPMDNLAPGQYTLVVTDFNKCKSNITITIESKWCLDEELAINSGIGESWELQIPEDKSGALFIYNRAGQLIYTESDISQTNWNGINNQGSFLDAGLYAFVIKLSDGTIKKGQITIVR